MGADDADIDNDAREKSELERERAAERYRTLAKLVRGYLFEGRLRPDGTLEFTWADDEFADIFGCEREEINRRGWRSFVDPRDLKSAEHRWVALSQGKQAEIELRIISTTGEKRWLRMAAKLLVDSATQTPFAFIGMAEDITSRKTLIEHMFQVIHNEQRRIGSDLHDGLGQVLTGVSLLLRSYHTRGLRGDAVQPHELEQLIDLITGAIETTRGLAHGLAPGTKEFGGLLSALNALVQRSRGLGLTIELWAPQEYKLSLDSTVSDHLYRIVQEAVTNAVRHAQAQRVMINLSVSELSLLIEVVDDGVGIPEGSKPGFGLHSMGYRADAIGAQLSIGAAQPNGTRVGVRLPV
jgi:two-component system sensor histidine kinase UhpB